MVDLDEQLREYSGWLASEADRVEAGREQARTVEVTSIHSARFRGRRWWPLVVVAAAVVIALAAVVVVGTPDAQAPADQPVVTSETTDRVVTASSLPESAATTIPALAPVATVPDLSGTPSGFDDAPLTTGFAQGAAGTRPQPWRDGFIKLDHRWNDVTEMELTDEIASMLPLNEIERLAPSWAPPLTVNQVGRQLRRLELLDEVTAELDDHPELVDALEAGTSDDFVTQAHFTVDGDHWRTIDLDPPTTTGPLRGTISELQVSDDRVIASTPLHDAVEHGELNIAWSSDLREWESMTVELDGSAESLVDVLSSQDSAGYELSVSGDRFILRRQPERNDGDEEFGMGLVAGQLGDSAAEWVTAPQADTSDSRMWSAHGTFYLTGDELWESTDGIVWRLIPGAADIGVSHVVELEEGTLFVPKPAASTASTDPGEQLLTFRDQSGVFRTVTPPNGVHGHSLWNEYGDFTWLANLGPDALTPDRWLVATVDGDQWLTLDVPEESYVGFDEPINGDSVLYSLDGETWIIATIPTDPRPAD